MQYNYNFHLHCELFDTSQMLVEFESFLCNRNVHNMCRYVQLNFFPAPHLIWGTDYQIRVKYLLLVLKKVNGEGRKFLVLYPLFEKASSKVDWYFNVMKFLGGAPTFICHFFRPSACHPPYLRNRTSSNHNFWHTCVKWWFLQVFFSFLKF